jgi:hypothetical protein
MLGLRLLLRIPIRHAATFLLFAREGTTVTAGLVASIGTLL